MKRVVESNEKLYLALLSVYQLLDERLPRSRVSRPREEVKKVGSPVDSVKPAKPSADTYHENELMTIKQAYLELQISRTTLFQLRRQGLLTSLYKNNGVRLIRTEVSAAKIWYSRLKGKL